MRSMRHRLDISLEQSLDLKALILECKKFRNVTLGLIGRIRNAGLAAQSHLLLLAICVPVVSLNSVMWRGMD